MMWKKIWGTLGAVEVILGGLLLIEPPIIPTEYHSIIGGIFISIGIITLLVVWISRGKVSSENRISRGNENKISGNKNIIEDGDGNIIE